mmetsp:Transcript_122223/g.171950  ORF Transcript_122223/g.171950 Transcript_122223/m.171950 type:complete len:256 (+) Transcript_122223:201-968(+)
MYTLSTSTRESKILCGRRLTNLEVLLVLLGILFGVVLLLVLLLGLFLLLGHLNLLEGRIRVHAELLGHKSVDMVHKRGRVGDLEARLDQCGLEEHLSRLCGGLVALAGLHLREEVHDHGMVRVYLQRLAAGHHGELLLVLEGLGFHDLLLLGRVAELRGHHHNRRVRQSLGDLHLLYLHAGLLHGTAFRQVRQLLLPPVRQGLVHVLDLVELLLLVFRLVQLHVGLLDGHELLALVVRQLLQARLVKVVRQHQDL